LVSFRWYLVCLACELSVLVAVLVVCGCFVVFSRAC